VKVGAEIWVLDAFKKKSKQGIKTPKADVDRVKRRLKVLQERLK
jgi:phage-related protein